MNQETKETLARGLVAGAVEIRHLRNQLAAQAPRLEVLDLMSALVLGRKGMSMEIDLAQELDRMAALLARQAVDSPDLKTPYPMENRAAPAANLEPAKRRKPARQASASNGETQEVDLLEILGAVPAPFRVADVMKELESRQIEIPKKRIADFLGNRARKGDLLKAGFGLYKLPEVQAA